MKERMPLPGREKKMNRIAKSALTSAAAVALGALWTSDVYAAPITAGDLVVVQVGDGVTTISGNSGAVVTSLREFSTGGVAGQTIGLPTAAAGSNQPLTLSGSATSEGFLQISTNGQYLTMGGYAAAPGTAGVTTATAATVNRVVGRVEVSTGNIDTTTALTDAYNASNIRSAVSTNGTDLWLGGNGGSGQGSSAGTRYTTLGATTSTALHSTTTNTRVVNIGNGQLYNDSSSTPFLGVGSVGSGLPTTSGQAYTELPGFPTSGTHSNYDVFWKDANTIYVADDGAVGTGGGIQKWTLSAGTWSLAYTLLNNGTTTTSVRGLAGTVDGSGNAVLYATTSATTANTLITVTDTGAGSTATVLATAPALTAFRGVEIIPVPEPTTLAIGAVGGLLMLRRRRR